MPIGLVLASSSPIQLPAATWSLDPEVVLRAADEVNHCLSEAAAKATSDASPLDFLDLIDFRMLSGMLGELFSSTLAAEETRFLKNPNLDGYPDLCDVSAGGTDLPIADYLHYPAGGIEVKNTFGYKRTGIALGPRQIRRGSIQPRLTWKAHHQETNYLLALQSDYIDRTPQVVAGFFSAKLTEADWRPRAVPRPGSTMTSFTETLPTAYAKLRDGVVFGAPEYLPT